MPINAIQKPADPANYTSWGSASPRVVSLIVIHVEAGSEIGTQSWFANPQAHVSAHYSISKAGTVYQHVQENDIAWHAGIPAPCIWNVQQKNPHPGINPNAYSIGIEHEGLAHEAWPDAQVKASAAVVADVCRRRSIPVDAAHVVGHHEIYAGHDCPSSGCPLELIIALAKGMSS